MNFIENMKLLLDLIKYTAKGFSVCKIYQILELKKENIKLKDNIELSRKKLESLIDKLEAL